MTNPVPGYNVSTPYGKRGSYWSCNEDSSGNGIHTGVDYASPSGTKVVAARDGTVQYSNHGSAFGNHQIDLPAGDGTRDFYAHMRSRAVANGARVKAGDKIGEVGSEGNVTGPHLHFERHKVSSGGWSCAIIVNPQPSIDYKAAPEPAPKPPEPEEDMPKFSRTQLTVPLKVKGGAFTTLKWDKVTSGDAGKKGEGYVVLGKTPYTATLTAQVTVASTSGQIRTRFVEKRKDDKGVWQVSETYPAVEHIITGGDSYIIDHRTQNVASGDRVVCEITLPEDGTVQRAELNVLYF
jgi:murein DD-endopeptidase MepM/ murein hydrolase activator NlpD